MKYSLKSIPFLWYGVHYKTGCGLTYSLLKLPSKCKCGKKIEVEK
jgi:hypothetical protein